MVRRVLLYGVLVLAVAGIFALRRDVRRPATVAPVAASTPLASLLDHPARAAARLAPDRRFLDALGEVAHVATGEPAARAAAAFENGGWTLRLGSRAVGRVSEFPRYAEMSRVLVEWARTLGAPAMLALSDTDVAPGTAEARRRGHAGASSALEALHALRAADLAGRMWSAGHRDAATARLGAGALAWLAAECFDEAGAGEAVAARALAWLAIAAAADSEAVARERVLLAAVMGYPAEAARAARALPGSDPVRLYALRDDEVLDAIASRGRSAGGAVVLEARWLALRRAVERGDLDAWTVAAQRGLDTDDALALPLLAGRSRLGSAETGAAAGARLLLAVATDLQRNGVAPAPVAAGEDRTLADAMEMFETLLESIPEPADGAILDREVLRGWYRGAFYSSLMGMGKDVIERLASRTAIDEFARSVGDGRGAPAVPAEFQRWFASLTRPDGDAEHRDALRDALRADLGGLANFGGAPRLESWRVLRAITHSADPILREGARELARGLDSRPAHLDAWGWILLADLFDIARAETLLGESVAASHPRDLSRRGWWAAYAGDRGTLEALLRDPNYQPEERAALIEALRVMIPQDSLRLDALSEQLVGDRPDDWRILGPYLRSLERRHRTGRVRDLTGEWLGRPDRGARPRDDIDARNRMAKACLDEGRFEEGYQAIHPVVASWQETAMLLGAELSDRRGEAAAAETLALAACQRHPASEAALALLADLYWRHGRHELAARTLAEASAVLSPGGWRDEVGPRFVHFQRWKPREAARAVDALFEARLGDWNRVGGLVSALAAAGRKDEVRELAARLGPAPGLEPEPVVAAYRDLRAALGDEAAADWLRRSAHGRDARSLARLHMHAYGARAGEAQWILPLPAGPPEAIEHLWLLRAAAAMRDGAGTQEQRAELLARFSAAGSGRHRRFARLVLGLEPADSTLALGLEPEAAGEACYWIGLRNQCDGDLRAAAEWYARAVDVNAWRSGEHHWAMRQLSEWAARNRSLERLGKEQGTPSVRPFAAPVALRTRSPRILG